MSNQNQCLKCKTITAMRAKYYKTAGSHLYVILRDEWHANTLNINTQASWQFVRINIYSMNINVYYSISDHLNQQHDPISYKSFTCQRLVKGLRRSTDTSYGSRDHLLMDWMQQERNRDL